MVLTSLIEENFIKKLKILDEVTDNVSSEKDVIEIYNEDSIKFELGWFSDYQKHNLAN